MMKAAHAFAGYDFDFYPAYAARIFDQHMGFKDKACIVLVDGERVSGVLMVYAAEHPFGPFRYSSETLWWIDEQSRGRAADVMLDFYEDWARDQDVSLCGIAAQAMAPMVARLYRRRGYTEVETTFSKRLKP